MSDPEVVRANARTQAWSTLFMNLATGLIAALGYRVFVEQRFDLTTLVWTFGIVVLTLTGHRLLDLLEAQG